MGGTLVPALIDVRATSHYIPSSSLIHNSLCQTSHILVLKEGKVEAEGTLDELLLNSEEIRRLWSGDPAFWARDVEVAGVGAGEGEGDKEREEALA